MATPFLGMRGVGDFAANQVPYNWEEYILREFPNGSAPLFAMTSMFRKEVVDSYQYYWWKKSLPTQAGSCSVYIDAGLGTAYVYATHQTAHGSAGDVIYVKVSESLAKEFNIGSLALLRDSDQLTVDVHGRVTDQKLNGSSSYLAIKLFEDDDNHSSSSSYNLATVDRILRYGAAYPDGSTAPNSINYDPDSYYNYAQNFRNTTDHTLVALATNLRTGDQKKEAKKECSYLHAQDVEKSAFFGFRYSGTGENSKSLRTSMGIIEFLKTYNSDNIVDYKTDDDSRWAGKKWIQGGKTFLNYYLTQLMRYGDTTEILGFAGDGALLGIMELAEAYADITLQTGARAYGIQTTQWLIPAGTVHFKTHPLFSHETTNQNTIIFLHPKNCKFCPLVGGGFNFNTKFEKDMQIPGQHSEVNGFTTKGGWKFYFENQFMVMYNIGNDNTA